MRPENWVQAANRFSAPGSPPIVLQGGEPTLYQGFYDILQHADSGVGFEIKTNLNFDVEIFKFKVDRTRLLRAGIIATYHPEESRIWFIIDQLQRLQEGRYKATLYAVYHPQFRAKLWLAKIICKLNGFDLIFKPFVGLWKGKVYGKMRYSGAVFSPHLRQVKCRTREILVGPDGSVYRCYADLFMARQPIGHICHERFSEDDIKTWRDCDRFGACSPCNIKVKDDPDQEFINYSSAEIFLGGGVP
jgi:MoaA/NifB/PqqE/SkfB family radical SAM enzyme